MRVIQDTEPAQGSNLGYACRPPVLAGCVLLALALTLPALLPTTAAAEQPPFWKSCENKAGAEDPAVQCHVPRGIGIDPNLPGHLYVADQGNRRILEFSAWGEFEKAWGWGVRNGEAKLQTCGPAAEPPSEGCPAGIQGGGAGQLGIANGIAVDSAGNVYVFDKTTNRRVQKFSPDGQFLRAWGKEVNTGTSGDPDLCTDAGPPTDVCQGGVAGTGPGQFATDAVGSYIAIDTQQTETDADDVVYVGDIDRIQKFDTDGAHVGEIALPEAGTVGSLAVDQAGGDLYFAYSSPVSGGKAVQPDVHRLAPSTGEVKDTIEVPIPTALTTDSVGNVYAFDDHAPGNTSRPGLHEVRLLKFDPAGELDEVVARRDQGQFDEETTGIAVGSACLSEGADVYLSNLPFADSFVRAWGPPPNDPKCPPKRQPPSITAQYAVSVGTETAQLEAQINPHFWSGTQGAATYFVQYATAACIEAEEDWGGACVEEHPVPPETLEAPVADKAFPAPVFLSGLEPDTAYRFRFAAESKNNEGKPTVEGQPVLGLGGTPGEDGAETAFATFPEPEGPNPACENQQGVSQRLPDCRAYELVSPVEKANGEIVVQENNPGVLARLDQAAASGEGLTYSSYRAFSDPESAPYSSQYIARRGARGWASEGVSAPQKGPEFLGLIGVDTLFRHFSGDLGEGWQLRVTEPVLAEGGVAGFANIYRRESASGEFEACTTAEPSLTDRSEYIPELQGASADGRVAIFRANGKLPLEVPPEASEETEGGLVPGSEAGIPQLYACDEAEGGGPRELSLVSVLRSGAASDETSSAGTGADPYGRRGNFTHALSENGSRIYWTTGSGSGRRIYLRTNPTEPQSAQQFGSAQGEGDLIGPALGEGRSFEGSGSATIRFFVQLDGEFAVGQEISGECLSTPGTEVFSPGTKVTAVEVEAGRLKITPGAANACSEAEIVGLASDEVRNATTGFGAFAAGQTIEGAGIAPGTTVGACSPSCGPAATSLTLSTPATQTGQGVALEAFSQCKEPAKACTVAVSAGESSARFWAATPDGSKAIYSEGTSLYRYDSASAASEEIAPGVPFEVDKGVAGASEDLSRVYFASTEVLPGALPNKVPARPDADGEPEEREPVEGKPNIYLHDAAEGSLAFVATLAEETEVSLGRTRVTPEGSHLAFMSVASPTGYDNTDRISGEPDAEAFLYDAARRELRCASCNPSGARPLGRELRRRTGDPEDLPWVAAEIPERAMALYSPRALSADGNRLFFNSDDALAPTDTNNRRDVYQWEAPGAGDCTEVTDSFSAEAGGCIDLISSGRSTEDSEFIDADLSGEDAFFTTERSLVPNDPGLVDIYDARVDGGLPAPPAEEPPCEGEACQSPPSPPEVPTPSSSLALPGGNVPDPPARCGNRARRAVKLARSSRALRRRARSAHSRRHAGRLRGRAVRNSRKAKRMSRSAKRCRRVARRRAR